MNEAPGGPRGRYAGADIGGHEISMTLKGGFMRAGNWLILTLPRQIPEAFGLEGERVIEVVAVGRMSLFNKECSAKSISRGIALRRIGCRRKTRMPIQMLRTLFRMHNQDLRRCESQAACS